jgi:hypothetical protein
MQDDKIDTQLTALERITKSRPDATLRFIAKHMEAMFVTEIRNQQDVDLIINAMKDALSDSEQSYISFIVRL